MTRRLAETEPLNCNVLMKDPETDRRKQCTGDVLDYNQHEKMFIVDVLGERYFFNRLCM